MTLKMVGCWLLAYRISRPFNTWPFPCPATVAPHLLKKLQFFRAQFSVGCVEQKQITQKSKEIWSSSMQKLLSCLSHTWVVYKKKTCGFLSFNKISFSKIFQETESHDVANVYKGHIENFLVGIGFSSVGVLPFQPESQEKICRYSLVDSVILWFLWVWGSLIPTNKDSIIQVIVLVLAQKCQKIWKYWVAIS